MRLRGLLVFGVACALASAANAALFTSTYKIHLDTISVTNMVFFERGGGGSYTNAFYNGTSGYSVGAGTGDHFYSFEAATTNPISSVILGMDGVDAVLFVNTAAAAAFTGQSFGTLFGGFTGSFSESDYVSLLSNANLNVAGARTTLQSFADYVRTNNAAWFDTTVGTETQFTAVRFSAGVPFDGGTSNLAPTPEPVTLALIGLAPLAYLKRRKARA